MNVVTMSSRSILALLACMSFVLTSLAQEQNRRSPLEVPDDEFVLLPNPSGRTSPAYRFSSPNFFATQVNVNAAGQNIVGDAANEPSIAVDPVNPNRMAIGWRQFNTVNSNFRQAGYAFTTNGGQTWNFPGVFEPGVFRSDPVLDADAAGNFYYNSLTVVGSDYTCDVFKSTTGGLTWDGGTFAHGGDKQWMTIDKSSSMGEGNIYAYWTSNFSSCYPEFFTRSKDRGGSYENCVLIPDDPFWGTLAVGPDGRLFVCGVGTSNFVVARSSAAMDSSHVVSWDTATVVNLGGDVVAFAGSSSPNPGGLHGQAWIAVDHSSTASRGNVYVLCSVRRFVGPDPLDVMFARSTDAGLTWSAPTRVNDDTSSAAWQWFGTMSVAPNGRIDVIWLDTRDSLPGLYSSLYYSYSTNGGTSWSANQRLSNAFDPHVGWPQQQKMGDYFHMVSDNAGANIAWAGTFNGEEDVYYGRISFPTSVEGGNANIANSFSLSQNFPNPFNPSTTIRFSLSQPTFAKLEVFNLLGQTVATLVADERDAGEHSIQWDASGMASGVYYYRLEAADFRQTKKLVLLK